MWKRISLSLMISCIAIFMSACFIISHKIGEKEAKSKVLSECINHSIENDEGNVIAKIYYDKPIISGNNYGANAINQFFSKESQGWLGGSNRLTHFQENWMDNFLKKVNEFSQLLGAEKMEVQPFLYTVDTKIMMHSDTMLSIMQIATVQTTGPKSWYYFGSTFDLKTGDLIPLNKIIKIDPHTLQELIVTFLSEKEFILNSLEGLNEVKRIYRVKESDSYEIQLEQEKIQMNYEYYYDGEWIYIIINHGVFTDTGCIMKWNGEMGDNFKASLIGYIMGKDNEIKEIEY